MGHTLPGCELLFREVDFAKGLQLFEKAFEICDIDHDSRAAALLCEDEGSPGLSDLLQERLRVSLEFGKRPDVLIKV